VRVTGIVTYDDGAQNGGRRMRAGFVMDVGLQALVTKLVQRALVTKQRRSGMGSGAFNSQPIIVLQLDPANPAPGTEYEGLRVQIDGGVFIDEGDDA